MAGVLPALAGLPRIEQLTMEHPISLLHPLHSIAPSIEPKFFRTLLNGESEGCPLVLYPPLSIPPVTADNPCSITNFTYGHNTS